ncbi:MAG: hypothetical protein GQ534_02290, partial [Candidatus Delongbacteria bacterium]|nr:hypothetical protein [Candidatus Delongbacteria bacterium]
VSKAQNADSLKLVEIRNKLYDKLKVSYNDIRENNYRQFQFHLPDNTSFLRFHIPNEYGDDLSSIRSTVKYTNEFKAYSHGFETGTTFSAFRYVFPLTYFGKHIGSVELSVSYLGILSKIEENRDIACSFMISREVVNRKVLESERNNYLTCNANKDFFVEKEGHDKILNKLIDGVKYPRIFKEFYDNEKAREIFRSFKSGTLIATVDDKNFTVTILRILNFDDEPVAYITAIEKDEFKNTLLSSYYIFGSIRLSMILLVLTLFVTTFLKNKQLKKARAELKVLDGLLPICSYCKKIRNDDDEWDPIETFIDKKSEAKFSHSVCPDCAKEHYGKILEK